MVAIDSLEMWQQQKLVLHQGTCLIIHMYINWEYDGLEKEDVSAFSRIKETVRQVKQIFRF